MASSKDTAAAKNKETRDAAKKARRQASRERYKQMWQAFQMQRKEDKLLLPLMAAALVGAIVVAVVIGLLVSKWWLFLVIGILLGVLLAFVVFTRRLERNMYKKSEGQLGAAGWALDNMRGQWRVTQAVANTTHGDAVHRAIGRPGIILVGEGSESRLRPLLAQEKKRTARLVGETPIYEFIVGPEEGQIPLRKLQRTLIKLPNNISTDKMDTLESRLAALTAKSGAQLPRGPLPQGAKMRSMQRTVRRRTGN